MSRDVTLYGPDGRPVRVGELTQEVAAPSLTGIRQAWNTSQIALGLTPERLAQVLAGAASGDIYDYLTLAEEMEEREPHYASVLGTRKRAVSGLDVVVEAASDEARDQELADAVRELVDRPEFGGLVEDLLDALGKGFSAVEIMWRRGATWEPEAYEWRDPRFFKFDQANGRTLRLLDEQNSFDGVPLPPYKFLVHTPKLKSGLPIRGGLARLAAVTYMAKAFTLTDWLAFAEVFGMPLRVGKYSAGATEDDIRKLVSAVANIGTDAAAVIPDAMRIEFIQGGTAGGRGGESLFLALAEWLDRQVSKAVIGQTMTSDDGSSLAQAKVHETVRVDIQRADAKQAANTLNRDLVQVYIDLNYGPQKRYPQVTLPVEEPEDITAMSEALHKLVPLGGLGIQASEVRDRLGFPDPEDGAVILGEVAGPEEKGEMPQNRHPAESEGETEEAEEKDEKAKSRIAKARQWLAGLFSQALNRAEEVDPLDDLEELDDWEAQLGTIVDPLLALAETAGDAEEFRAGLAALAGRSPSDRLRERLAAATFTAQGIGDAGDEG